MALGEVLNCISCGADSGDGILCENCACSEGIAVYNLIGDTLFTEIRAASSLSVGVGPSTGSTVMVQALPSLDREMELIERRVELSDELEGQEIRLERVMNHTGISERLGIDADLLLSREAMSNVPRALNTSEKMRKGGLEFSARLETLLGNASWLCDPVTSCRKSTDPDDRQRLLTERSANTLSFYDRSLSIDTSYLPAQRNRAVVLYAVDRDRECIDACKEYLGKVPDDPEMWGLKGSAHYREGEHEDALRSLDNALRLSPKDPTLWTKKGQALLGDTDGAVALRIIPVQID